MLVRGASWLGRHKQRLSYGLAAAFLVAAVAAATVGGFYLHHSAELERTALRTQELATAVVRLEDAAPAARPRALAAAQSAFDGVRAHDKAEAARLHDEYLAATAPDGRRDLGGFVSAIGGETKRLASETSTTNPRARLALILAAISALLLVTVLIWQFELQRRAGRIDRDNAARAAELGRLREDFVAAVSHELRTPLTSIIGYLDLISDEAPAVLSAEQERFLTIAQRNAARLHELIGDLLLIAEADSGMLALDVREISLDDLAQECVESARPTAGAKQIELSLHKAAGAIEGDPVRLAQMMDNLVSNAIKFTPAGGRVSVRTGSDNGYAMFEVSDSGDGISPADQEHLFDRFFRARSAVDQAIKGTGLGLAITKAIIDAHDGTISVDSAVGSHSTFRVHLPRRRRTVSP